MILMFRKLFRTFFPYINQSLIVICDTKTVSGTCRNERKVAVQVEGEANLGRS